MDRAIFSTGRVTVADSKVDCEPNEPADHSALELDAAVARGACQIANAIKASLLVCLTRSGRTARLLSQARPGVPIVALSASESVLRSCALFRNVQPIRLACAESKDGISALAKAAAKESGLATAETRMVIVAGGSLGKPEMSNLIQVEIL